MNATQDPDAIIELLGMVPHPEGGHYVETFRAAAAAGERAAMTAIYFLLKAGERSHWHKVDAVETWLWHAGGSLQLSIDTTDVTLGPDLGRGERPQAVVPKDAWQAARSLGHVDASLVRRRSRLRFRRVRAGGSRLGTARPLRLLGGGRLGCRAPAGDAGGG